MALLKAPALNLKAGNKLTAVRLFRTMLQAEESESTKVSTVDMLTQMSVF